MKAGQDIHVKWTATSGNVSTLDHSSLIETNEIGLLVYLQRLEYLVVGTSWMCIGERLLGVEEYDYEICRTFMVKSLFGCKLIGDDIVLIYGICSYVSFS